MMKESITITYRYEDQVVSSTFERDELQFDDMFWAWFIPVWGTMGLNVVTNELDAAEKRRVAMLAEGQRAAAVLREALLLERHHREHAWRDDLDGGKARRASERGAMRKTNAALAATEPKEVK